MCSGSFEHNSVGETEWHLLHQTPCTAAHLNLLLKCWWNWLHLNFWAMQPVLNTPIVINLNFKVRLSFFTLWNPVCFFLLIRTSFFIQQTDERVTTFNPIVLQRSQRNVKMICNAENPFNLQFDSWSHQRHQQQQQRHQQQQQHLWWYSKFFSSQNISEFRIKRKK